MEGSGQAALQPHLGVARFLGQGFLVAVSVVSQNPTWRKRGVGRGAKRRMQVDRPQHLGKVSVNSFEGNSFLKTNI